MATKIPKDVLKYFQRTGAEGGKSRAKKHSKEQLSAWGKKGGRPKGSGKKKPKVTVKKTQVKGATNDWNRENSTAKGQRSRRRLQAPRPLALRLQGPANRPVAK